MSTERTKQVAFRLPESLVKRLDDYAEELAHAQPGLTFTRADAVRVLLVRALDATTTTPKRRARKTR
jgi:hypothetical protein